MDSTGNAPQDLARPPARRILAPHPWPFEPELDSEPDSGRPLDHQEPRFYLSWPGWELYLARRLGWRPAPEAPAPLLLPNLTDPERDFAAIDQLIQKAGELGAGFLSLERRPPESLAGLTAALRRYHPLEEHEPLRPLLDDRSYLALWAAAEYQARQSQSLLARAAERQRAMWAALKGEEPERPPTDSPPTESINSASIETAIYPPVEEPDGRTAYAWQCWRRLAAPLLRPSDVIIPTAALP